MSAGPRPGMDEVRTLCQRVRSAGSPNARARTPLVKEYQRIASALGVTPMPVEKGLDLQRAAASLLRAASLAEAAAAATPGARLRAVRAAPRRSPSRVGPPTGPVVPSASPSADRETPSCGHRPAHRRDDGLRGVQAS